MRKLYLICLLWSVLPLAAQVPDWYNVASRKTHYPSESYYTGYVEGNRQSSETLENAIARLKDAARVELATTIRTSIEQTMDSRTQSDIQQSGTYFDEQIRETFISETRISSSIKDIPGLKAETYQNPKNGEICAFAYVKRSTLINHLIKRITLLSGKAENDWQQAQELKDNGQKMQARSMAARGLQQLAQAEEAQNLLVAVDETADEETLQFEQTRSLYRQLKALSTELQNAIAVYLECEAQLFSGKYTALKGAIEGAFSEQGVSFVSSADKADWAIYISASAKEHAKSNFGSMSNYATFVETHIDIDQINTGKRIYSSGLTSGIANHTRGFEPAAREAYKNITPQVIDVLKKQIGL